ncbi:Cutinase [Lachnellula hyalina]|uniref:Cutinase n=1 Tax=Lachnellula hyalina TaxID=1316788 RepID=A0A8H8U0L6_9HELO|nr:Cutinase [Lachnellula hyalina]TVY26156.1 Cutinase [Lachnellula hyalina]
MRFSIWTIVTLLGLTLASPVPAPHLNLNPRASIEKRQTPLNAFLSLLLEYLPAVDGTLDSVLSILTNFELFLATLTGEQTTYNELGGTCTEYTVIFARGTTEPGNVGVLVGPPFFDALTTTLGASALTIQGVNDYDADIAGYEAGGDAGGSAEMAKQISAAMAACPDTKLVASGYSQGGQIVHNAAAQLPAATASWISKVVVFGDPDNGTAIANVDPSKVKTFCNVGDNICVNGDLILVPHLIYGENAEEAATFVAS